MITFIILLSILLALAITIAVVLVAIGTGFIAVFGDLIVFGLIIWLIIRIFRRKRE